MSTKTRLLISVLFVFLACPLLAKNIYVDDDAPADFNNIQAAIDYADINDTVFVSEGTYYENISMKNGVSLEGASAERTIIDGREKGHVVVFNLADGEISGFTITNSGNNPGYVGGIFISQAFVRIENNIIINNNRGIIVSSNSFAVIKRNKIINNTRRGVALSTSSSAVIENNIISGNSSAGINASSEPIIVINNTICDNGSYGIICVSDPNHVIINNIIAYNKYGILILGKYQSPYFDISYNNVWNNSVSNYWYEWGIGCITEDPCCVPKGDSGPFEPQPGIGEISSDPLFADPNVDDFHLKSQAGRWDPNTQSWVRDDVTSPCIDAGDPMSPIGYEPFPNGGRINMGAYCGTAEASKSYFGEPVCETIVAGDINGDCRVDFKDLAILTQHWLEDRQ